MKKEDLKVGMIIQLRDLTPRCITAIGEKYYLYKTTDAPNLESEDLLDCLDEYELYKIKKRYWLWDVSDFGGIYKTNYYLDDVGEQTNGTCYINAKDLVKKHENEWIEV